MDVSLFYAHRSINLLPVLVWCLVRDGTTLESKSSQERWPHISESPKPPKQGTVLLPDNSINFCMSLWSRVRLGRLGLDLKTQDEKFCQCMVEWAGALGHRMSNQQRKALEEIMKWFMFWRNADEVWQSSLFDRSHRFSNTILSLLTFVFGATRLFAKCIHGKPRCNPELGTIMLIYAAPRYDAEHEAATWKGCEKQSCKLQILFLQNSLLSSRFSVWQERSPGFGIFGSCQSADCIVSSFLQLVWAKFFDFSWSPF